MAGGVQMENKSEDNELKNSPQEAAQFLKSATTQQLFDRMQYGFKSFTGSYTWLNGDIKGEISDEMTYNFDFRSGDKLRGTLFAALVYGNELYNRLYGEQRPSRLQSHENKILTITKEKEQKDMAKKEKELVFDKKLFADARNIRVRIEDDCVEIVNDIWLQTGLSATKIVSEMIRFASQHVVLRTPMCFADDEEE